LENEKRYEITKHIECLLTEKGTIICVFFLCQPVKTSGEGVYVNGVLSGAHTGTTNFTADISPYLVFSSQKK
jgi:hypothetical protein